MEESISYGTSQIDFTLLRKDRKTLAIEVHPDLSIHVIAPTHSSLEDIKAKVLKRGRWITQQLQYFDQFLPRTPEREYVPGETHLYLGKKYLLKTRKSKENKVRLVGGELQVFTNDSKDQEHIKRLLTNWYYQHAKRRFRECIRKSLGKFEKYQLAEPPLVIKRMNKRWGSCTPNGRIILNPEIIKAPSRCIEYVVIHELCHLIHPNHSKAFYQLQTEIMPDWQKWKERLEKVGS